MRKRKPKPPTTPQHQALGGLYAAGATSPSSAAPPPEIGAGQPSNTLNRLLSRGWIGATEDRRRFWITGEGALALAAMERAA